MFEYNDRQYRSLQEQVKYNSELIANHYKRDRILADLGIKIMGQVNTVDDLPDTPPGGAEAYGEAYAVGEEAPYHIYIWTRPDEQHNEAYWFDIGEIAIKGDPGEEGATIKSATINANNQLVITMTDDRVITVPGNLKGETGASPRIVLSNIADGVKITVNNPDGTSSTATVKNGLNGQNGAQGMEGPPGFFNILGTLANEGQLPSASSVDLGSAYLVWHAVAEEENGGHYDLWLNINGNSGQVWQNTGRVAAGTYIFQDGQVINEFNADSKVDKITTTGSYKLYGVNPNGGAWIPTLRQDPQTTSTTYKYQPVMYDITANKSVNNGLIRVSETPIENYHTASKAYVDNRYRLYRHDINFIVDDSGDSYTCYFTLYNTQATAMNNATLHTDNFISISGVVDKADGRQYPIQYGTINPDISYVLLYYYAPDEKQMISVNLDASSFTTYDTVSRVI